MDNAPQEAITSLLSLHVAPSADHSPPPPVEGFEIASVLIADQTPAKDDVKKDLEKLTEAFQSSSNDVTLQPDVTSGVDVTTNFKISKQTSETESSVSYDHDMHTRPGTFKKYYIKNKTTVYVAMTFPSHFLLWQLR